MTHEDYAKYWQTMKDFRDYVSWLEKYNTMPSLEMMVEQYQEELQPMIESFKVK
ncbi:hypothetical protein [Bacillus sp. AFS017274]|uniref:hypothetical protein n=1 Tax=Bacillaceae TaxID=186817 RepID=UPI0015CF2C8F|nr:hypothetical protein [Bacillus sp. AFS017274]